jgi:hypothetical protein
LAEQKCLPFVMEQCATLGACVYERGQFRM